MNVRPEPIVVEQVFNAPIATVWKAVTDKSEMPQWFFEPITDFEPRVGFETKFTVSSEGQNYEHLWKVLEVISERRIVYEWRYSGIPGNSTVTWELSETVDGTKLRFTHSGIETFPQDDPVFERETGVAGWEYFINERLKGFLEKNASN